MGDGVLAYFGYPQAHEDDAKRAVRAGLALITAVTELKKPPRQLQGRAGSTRAFSHLISRSISSRSEFCKPLRNAWKQPDQNGMGLQNRVRDFNGLAESRCATVTAFPTGFSSNFNGLICCSAIACGQRCEPPARHGALAPAGRNACKHAPRVPLDLPDGPVRSPLCRPLDRVSASSGPGADASKPR